MSVTESKAVSKASKSTKRSKNTVVTEAVEQALGLSPKATCRATTIR